MIDRAACPFPKRFCVLHCTSQSHEAARAGIVAVVIITIILLLMQIDKQVPRVTEASGGRTRAELA